MLFSKTISKEISLAIAISLYLLFIFLAIIYVKDADVKKFDALNKTTVLDLNIIIDNSEVKEVKKVEQVKTKKSSEVVKKSKSRTVKQQNNVKSLFANVSDYSEKVIEKEVKNVTKSEVSSRFKAKFEKQRKSEEVSVSNILKNVTSKASVASSVESNNDTDPYFSKINEILNKRWNPLIFDDGLFAKVLVSITNDGKFNYKFMKFSGDERFDSSLRAFLNEQIYITFPEHSRGSLVEIEVNFKSEG